MYCDAMRRDGDRPRRSRRLLIEPLEGRALLATLTVVNTNDAGAGSLRQAIGDANAAPGASTIDFNIPGGGVQTIRLLDNLNEITRPVTIDGSSQPGYAGSPLIAIDGAEIPPQFTTSSMVNASIGLAFRGGSGGSIVRGLSLTHFGSVAIDDDGANISILDNAVGVGPDLTPDPGVDINLSSTAIVVGPATDPTGPAGTLIMGNTIGQNNIGILLNKATGVTIARNFIGTDPGRAENLGNSIGIEATAGTTGASIAHNVIANCPRASIDDQTDGGVLATDNILINDDADYARLTSTVTPSQARGTVGQTIRMTITTTNGGPSAAKNAYIFVYEKSYERGGNPAGAGSSAIVQLLDGTASQGTPGPNTPNVTYLANLGTIEPGGSATVTVDVKIVGVGTDVVVAGSGRDDAILGDPHTGSSTTFVGTAAVDPTPDLAVMASASPAVASVGVPEFFTFTVTNRGATAADARFALSTAAPLFYTGIGMVPGTAETGVIVSQGGVVAGSIGIGTRSYSGDLGTLAPGASATVTVAIVPPVAGVVSASLYAYSPDAADANPADQLALASAGVPEVAPRPLLAGGTALPTSKGSPIAAISLYFGADLVPGQAKLAGHYAVNGRAVRSASYDPTTRVVTLRPSRPIARTGPALNVTVAGLLALTGRPFFGPSITVAIPRS